MAKRTSKAKPARAREDDGQYKGDDPATPDVNEAYADGVGPADPDPDELKDTPTEHPAHVVSIGVFPDSADRYIVYAGPAEADGPSRQHAFPAGQEVAVGDCVRSLLQELI